MTMMETDLPYRVEAVRAFNRFYTRQIGVLEESLLHSSFSLTEARLLYELAQRGETAMGNLAHELGLDENYVERIVRGFWKRDLVGIRSSETRRREKLIALTVKGLGAFAELDATSSQEVGGILVGLSPEEQDRLIRAMNTIRSLLENDEPPAPYLLREHVPGDMGWVVQRHGELYHREYGWDERFEGIVAGVVADFIRNFDPKRERCWIAERDGERIGSIFLVKHPDHEDVAKLRLLLVEPDARGLGLGRTLVRECTLFARQAGYRTITLWTNSLLHAARRIYEQEGYRLVHEEPHQMFGEGLIGQTWELAL